MAEADGREKPAALRSRLIVSTRLGRERGGRGGVPLYEAGRGGRDKGEEVWAALGTWRTDRETIPSEATKERLEARRCASKPEAC